VSDYASLCASDGSVEAGVAAAQVFVQVKVEFDFVLGHAETVAVRVALGGRGWAGFHLLSCGFWLRRSSGGGGFLLALVLSGGLLGGFLSGGWGSRAPAGGNVTVAVVHKWLLLVNKTHIVVKHVEAVVATRFFQGPCLGGLVPPDAFYTVH